MNHKTKKNTKTELSDGGILLCQLYLNIILCDNLHCNFI